MTDNIWKRYWGYYGGWRALVTSYYLWASFLVSAVFYPMWSSGGWWNYVLGVTPSLLGFSLGGYAMWIAFGDSSFRKMISGDSDGKPSPFMEVSAAFVHFMIVQLLAILVALLAKAYYFELSSTHWLIVLMGEYYYYICLFGFYLGFSIFVYSLFSAMAAIMALFRAAHWYDKFNDETNK